MFSDPVSDLLFLPLGEAVRQLVLPRAAIAMEGFNHLIPFAAEHEINRQGINPMMESGKPVARIPVGSFRCGDLS